MTVERNCKTCGYYNADRCVRPDGCCFHHSKWQPIAQEKPMENKVIFESREDCYKFCEKVKLGMNHEAILWHVNEIEKHGYIRKSAVEEAEEEYIAYKEGKNCFVVEIVMDKMYLAIQELKSEIARGKK